MAKHSPANERVKRDYFAFLREAKGRDTVTIDRVAQSLAKFEKSTRHKDFKSFRKEQAIAFKKRVGEAVNAKSGERLSKATVQSTLRDLKAFVEWLSREPGYRSHLSYSDAEYFNVKEKDAAIARARREKKVPTLEQVRRVLESMPAETVLERRDLALVAFATITGARVNALASFRLEHVDIERGFVEQDARTVRTKFAKTFRTYFMPVSEGALEIVSDWVRELREDLLRGPVDPLFPATEVGVSEAGIFEPTGLARKGWASTGPVRDVFRKAFEAAGLPYYNPHSFRDMLVRHAMKLDLTPEEMKAWSQNLGHSDVMTTLSSYGPVPTHRQGELIQELGQGKANDEEARIAKIVAETIRRMQEKD
ncbi:site-specific integrase [Erythrobacter sp. JK5]|uniref:tyrosine-type recombinase/integrase n=1 Tax=Erythrobacter sp. JK5 TaxID=2829500 RepID=UPI001BA60FFB|nr:site-specific integrase [Erythrobacter sp. JK5]QUL37809.1 site-specific integrase [Erythrobacter sp. JK5]